MTIKDLLLPLTSYPAPTGTAAIERAIALAKNLGASISAMTFEMDFQSPIGLYADPVGVRGILAADRKKSAENARALFEHFDAIATKHAVAHDQRLVQCTPVALPDQLAHEARLHDMSVMALGQGDGAGERLAEQLIFQSGRPVLVLPDDDKRELAVSFDNVAVAWDFSCPAARALADAMPLLRAAKQVRVFTVVDEKAIGAGSSGALAKHLVQHGVQAVMDDVKSGGHPVGRAIESYVAAHKSDLLVMGAYGHSRMREFILGGATNSMLAGPPGWVLLSH